MPRTLPDPEIDEHVIARMRGWLMEKVDCSGCSSIVLDASDEDILAFIEGDYPGGVDRFLGDLETGNGELP
jgi:hypothetical protein